MDTVQSTYEACDRRGYNDEVLQYTLRDESIADILEMTVSKVLKFFENTALRGMLEALNDVDLNYLMFGRLLLTLSGGEYQHIKVSRELHKTGASMW
ncbi:hypothetical protein ACFFQF_17560 [Haladaptatus pallidirubidus]|uniref:Uncharacterized protein n=1 Tax=Haladaptatus pallidirubidus TaxID=1008152 RepID=A0AAV3UQS6_9EURY|nr:hypothetical protein [Haladaptatus pallidirubidus]